MNYYAFGLRKTVPCKTVDQVKTTFRRYESYVAYLKYKYTDMRIDFHYENKITKGNKHNVHLHGMISSRKLYTIGDLPRQKGMKVYLEPVRNKHAYKNYINKDNTSKQQLLDLIQFTLSQVSTVSPTPTVSASVSSDEDEYIEELKYQHQFAEKLRNVRII